MLVLSRRIGESLLIGDEITLTILATKGNQVRVGLVAPTNLSVLREELRDEVDRHPLSESKTHPSPSQ